MHLLESYALTFGQKIGKPEIVEKFYPINYEKYITFQPFSKPSKNYDYWNCVLDILLPILEKQNIKIVQIGGPNEVALNGCIHTQGGTTFGQAAFLIKNSLLHLGTDSFGQHLASGYNKKIVVLISNNYKECSGPYWGNKENHIVLEPPRKENERPSLALEEPQNNKQINRIKPEQISSAVCKLLNIEHTFPYKTVMFGETYPKRIIEMVPDCLIDPAQLQIDNAIIRADWGFQDERFIYNQLNRSKCSIISDKVLNFDVLKQLKNNITQFLYVVNKNYDLTFAKNLVSLGVNATFITYENEEWWNEQKLDWLDVSFVHQKKLPKQSDIPELKDKDLKNLKFISSKFTLSNGKIYPSKSHWQNGKSVCDFNHRFLPCLDNETFLSEKEYYWIVE